MANVKGRIGLEYTIVEIGQGANAGKFQAHVTLSGDTGRPDSFFYIGRACDTRGEALSWAVGYAFDHVKV